MTITATIVTGTSSASIAAIACALPDQVSERMPPSTTVTRIASTSSTTIRLAGSPTSQPAAKAPMLSSAASSSSIGTDISPADEQPHRAALEPAAEIARHRERAELAEERRQHDRHDDEAREPADHRHRASKPMRKKVPVMATMPVAPIVALAMPSPV